LGGIALISINSPIGDDDPAGSSADPDAAITAVILCGGAGRRVGGVDKPLLPFGGRPLVERVVERVRPQVDQVIISANRNVERYAAYGKVVTDPLPGYAGPLAGILAALGACNTPWLVACAGDAPDLPADLVQRCRETLRNRAGNAGAIGVAVFAGGQLEPLPVLVHRSTAASLADYLAAGRRSVHGWLATLALARADFSCTGAAFASMNNPEDFGAGQLPICDCR
jgi:molybdenum cofactor guanylyltransferase